MKEYLLKPIDYDELKNMAARLAEEIRAKKEEQQEVRDLQKYFNQSVPEDVYKRQSYGEKTEYQDMNNGEFDFYIRFVDKEDDIYYYCFKDEGFHFIYHRFLPEDYEEFGF